MNYADLRNTQLHCANLEYAELYGANMKGAKLYGTKLSHAKLHGANLETTEIYAADLTESKLLNVNLNGASIYGSNLRAAQLNSSSWSRISIKGSLLRKVNLTDIEVLYVDDVPSVELHGSVVLTDLAGAKCEERASSEDSDLLSAVRQRGQELGREGTGSVKSRNLSEWMIDNGRDNYFGDLGSSSCWSTIHLGQENPWHEGSAPWRQGYAERRKDFLLKQLACWDQTGHVAREVIEETIRFSGVEEQLRSGVNGSGDSCEGLKRGWQMYLAEKDG